MVYLVSNPQIQQTKVSQIFRLFLLDWCQNIFAPYNYD